MWTVCEPGKDGGGLFLSKPEEEGVGEVFGGDVGDGEGGVV